MAQINFGEGAADYGKLADQVSQNIASAALERTGPFDSHSRILDLACGTGEITSLILENATARGCQPPPTVIGLDIAQEMVKLYNERAEANRWTTASAKVQDAQNLEGFDNNQFDLVFMNFGIMFVPDGTRCMKEVYRVLKPGGHAVFTTWKEAGVPRLLARATAAADASRPFPVPEGEWNTREKLISTVRSGGFGAEHIEVVVEQTKFQRGSGDGIVEALSTPFWNPLHDGSVEATTKWQDALRQQLTPEQEESGEIDMIAWVCVAQKEF